MTQFLYDDYVRKLSDRFDSALKYIQATYNFDLGEEFEIALCEILRSAIPLKFGISRGFVVDQNGGKAGDDIVIYDRYRFPTLRALGDDKWTRKEQIPIEAVFAYIEAKHTVEINGDGASSLLHATEQVNAVKTLCGKRKPMQHGHILSYAKQQRTEELISGKYPEIRNPVFGAIIARQVRDKAGGKVISDSDSLVIRDLLEKTAAGENPPDLLIAGKSIICVPAIPEDTGTNSEYVSAFLIPNKSVNCICYVDGIAFGIGLASLLSALEWIELNPMPWSRIVADGLKLPIRTKN